MTKDEGAQGILKSSGGVGGPSGRKLSIGMRLNSPGTGPGRGRPQEDVLSRLMQEHKARGWGDWAWSAGRPAGPLWSAFEWLPFSAAGPRGTCAGGPPAARASKARVAADRDRPPQGPQGPGLGFQPFQDAPAWGSRRAAAGAAEHSRPLSSRSLSLRCLVSPLQGHHAQIGDLYKFRNYSLNNLHTSTAVGFSAK